MSTNNVIFGIMTIGIIGLPLSTIAEEADFFPIQVGNRWIYQSVQDSTEYRDLEVTGTLNIDVDALPGMTQIFEEDLALPPSAHFAADELPLSENGRLHYILRGTLLDEFLLNYSSIEVRLSIEAILLREPLAEKLWVDFIREDFQEEFRAQFVQSGWTSGGVLIESEWFIYGWDQPFMNRSKDRLSWWHLLRPDLQPGSLARFSYGSPTVPSEKARVLAGFFPDNIHISSFGPDKGVYLAAEVGIFRVCNSTVDFQLKEAIVNGVYYPVSETSIEYVPWSHLKQQEK